MTVISNVQYTLVGVGDGTEFLSVFVPGKIPQPIHSSHPNFFEIKRKAIAGDSSVYELLDVVTTVATKFERLTDQITAANGLLYWDGEVVDDALTKQIVRFMNEGADFKPLVKFFENVMQNPSEHSRKQLYTWLTAEDFTITSDGLILGYKGVAKDGNGGYVSVHSGKAIVNGEVKSGRIPNPIGAIVEMPRGDVTHDPAVGCHYGLHVGTYSYASSFANGGLLEVHVHPRDVVSVPVDSNARKMRVCRYKVVDTIDAPVSSAFYDYENDDDYEDGWWGEKDDEYSDPIWR